MDASDERLPAERLSPEDLPRLALFLARYLGWEGAATHGSAAAAAHDYAAEAELDELDELAHEWEILRAAARTLSLAELNRTLATRFGGPWQAVSVDELDAVAAELERALRE